MRWTYSHFLETHPGLAKIAHNAGWLMADRVLRMALNVVISVWVARYLGPARFGEFNYALAFIGPWAVLGMFGLESIVVRDLVRRPQEANLTLGTAYLLRTIGGVGTYVVAFTLAFFVHGPRDEAFFLIAIFAAGQFLSGMAVADFWFQAHLQVKHPTRVRFVIFLFLAAARVALVLLKAPLVAFVIVEALFNATSGQAALWCYRRVVGPYKAWQASRARAWTLLRDSWPLMLSGLAINIYMNIDQIMLKNMISEKEVGNYSAALRLSGIWYFVPMALTASLMPTILRSKELGSAIYLGRMQRLFALMTALSLCLAVPMTFLSGWVIHLVYGGRFDAAGPILGIHIWTSLFVFWGVAQEPWMISEGLQKISMRRTIAGAVCNVLLNFIFIPRWGGQGAATATVIAQAVSANLSNLFHPRTRIMFLMHWRSIFFPLYLLPHRSAGPAD